MARHFGPQHMKNGYAAMGGNKHRPRFSSTVAERAKEARDAKAGKKK